jgi:hypothetical protein
LGNSYNNKNKKCQFVTFFLRLGHETNRIETLDQEVDEVDRDAEIQTLFGTLHEESEAHGTANATEQKS